MIKQQFNSKAAIPLGLAHTPLNFMIVLFDPAVQNKVTLKTDFGKNVWAAPEVGLQIFNGIEWFHIINGA